MPKSSVETKEKIILAYIDCVAEIGYHRVTYEVLGERSGVSKALVYYHFKDLDTLSQRAVEYYAHKGQEATVAKLSNEAVLLERIDRLAAFVDAIHQMVTENSGMSAVISLSFYQAQFDPEYRKFYLETRLTGQKRIAAIVAQFFGLDHLDSEAQRIARIIQNIISGQYIDYACRGSGDWDDCALETKRAIADYAKAQFLKHDS